MSTFSFNNLVPDFCQLPISVVSQFNSCKSVIPNPSESISAVIISVLIFISVGFLIFSLVKFVQSRLHVGSYFKLLGNMGQSDLVARRKDITDRAAKKKGYFGRLWREFDESLVLHRTGDGDYKLSNTLDAAHFFNTHSLARGLTENRLLAAVPGLLTAIGVIGTFAGLQMGLSGIDLSSDDVGLLKEGIKNMIEGASVAFLTSLWGIALSVAFNLVEKTLERSVRRQIGRLQNHIDFLYPRINAEQSLVEIADTSREGTQTMQGLAEQIGNKMQEAMVLAGESITTGLKDSLHEILSPALEKMAADAHTGSEKALESMLNRFMDGFGQAGEDQRSMMNQSSKEVQQAVGKLGSQMTQFMDNLDDRSKGVEEQNRLQREQLETMLKDYEGHSDKRQEKMAGQFDTLMQGITSGVDEQMKAQQQRDHERMQSFKVQLHQVTESQKSTVNDFTSSVATQLEHQNQLDQVRNERANEQINKMQLSQEELGGRLESLLAYQQQSHKQLYEELTALQEGFKQITDVNRTAAADIKSSSDHMQATASQMSNFGARINDAATSMGENIEKAVKATQDLSLRNVSAVEKLDAVLNQYQQFAAEISHTSEKLRLATEHADHGFTAVDQHLQSFQQSMQSQVKDMQQQMQELMTHFAEQVRAQTVERIQVWTDETSKYNSVMTQAINTIADVVDDIEDRVGAN